MSVTLANHALPKQLAVQMSLIMMLSHLQSQAHFIAEALLTMHPRHVLFLVLRGHQKYAPKTKLVSPTPPVKTKILSSAESPGKMLRNPVSNHVKLMMTVTLGSVMDTLHVPRRKPFIVEPHLMMLQPSVVIHAPLEKMSSAKLARNVSSILHVQTQMTLTQMLSSTVLNQHRALFWPWA
jgi:hypothetical protein